MHYQVTSLIKIVAERVESVDVPSAQLVEAGINVDESIQIMQRTLMKVGKP